MLKKINLSLTLLCLSLFAFAQSPEFSTEDSPIWYNIQFKTGGNVLSDPGSGNNLVTATKSKTDATLWQFIGNKSDFYLKSKKGNYVNWSGSRFTSSSSNKVALKMIDTTNSLGGFEIQRKAASGVSMNQWGGTSTGVQLGEWNAGDNNNPVTFLATSAIPPIFSIDDTEQWYFIQFAISDQSFKACGEGENVVFATPDHEDAQLWKLVGTIDNFQLVSKTGLYATVKGSGNNARVSTSSTECPYGFKLVETTSSTYSNMYEIHSNNSSLSGKGMNRWGGGELELSEIGFWTKGDNNNPVKFTKMEDMKYADFKIEGATSFTPESELTLWYNEPATTTDAGNKWMEYSLPIGNGQLGACLFGGIQVDEIQFNEKTLWTGGPNDMGSYGGYKNFGSVLVEDLSGVLGYGNNTAAKNYVRYLDIETATAGVKYTNNDGSMSFERKYIASEPDGVIAARYTADGGKLNLRFSFSPGAELNASDVTYTDNSATFGGKLTTVSHNARFRVVPTGDAATLTHNDEGITVANADEVLLILCGATDYDSSVASFVSGTSELPSRVEGLVNAAAEKGWDAIYTAHVDNFKGYMGRVSLRLGEAASSQPTNVLIDNYNNASKHVTGMEPEVLFLEQLYFAYGRYLHISSSRGVDVPSNLQGIWNNLANAPWNSDIHSNINVQMNYWPAEPTNLSELHMPFLNYIITMANGNNWKAAAKRGGQSKGWTCFTENNIFGGMSTWGSNYFVANAWYCSHLWQHYRYTLDKEFLTRAFPVMWSCAEFWIERMIKDRKVNDGTWVCPDEYSPEQNDHPTEDATAHAQQLVYMHLLSVKKSLEVLGQDVCGLSDDQVATLNSYLENTDQGLHIETFKGGSWVSWGSTYGVNKGDELLREWKYTDYDVSSDKAHRHMSHLMCLYPLDQVTPSSRYFTPAVNALKLRGDEATGWSMGWKVNLWARALDGDHAHIIVRNALKHSTSYGTNQYAGGIYYNLFDSHSPFQIDGNFGVCAGIAEMLMQSHTDTIHIHPALPSVWASGKVEGLKAVGDFTVGIEWNEGKATKITVDNNQGTPCYVKYADIDKCYVTVNGEEVKVVECGDNVFNIPSAAGDEIIIDFQKESTNIGKNFFDVADPDKIYDLTGRQVENTDKKGIYIKRGEKFIVK